MFKVEYEFVHFNDDNLIVHQSQHYYYFETLQDAIKGVYERIARVASTAQVCYLYIWHDGDMIFHAECNEGVWS